VENFRNSFEGVKMRCGLLVALWFAVACGGGNGALAPTTIAPSVSATWSGPVLERGFIRYTDTLTVTLVEAGGQVSGSGTYALDKAVANGFSPAQIIARGSFNAPLLTVSFQLAANPSISYGQFSGVMSNRGDVIVGQYSSSGVPTQQVTLTRQ
jgi:hypothetical protein